MSQSSYYFTFALCDLVPGWAIQNCTVYDAYLFLPLSLFLCHPFFSAPEHARLQLFSSINSHGGAQWHRSRQPAPLGARLCLVLIRCDAIVVVSADLSSLCLKERGDLQVSACHCKSLSARAWICRHKHKSESWRFFFLLYFFAINRDRQRGNCSVRNTATNHVAICCWGQCRSIMVWALRSVSLLICSFPLDCHYFISFIIWLNRLTL